MRKTERCLLGPFLFRQGLRQIDAIPCRPLLQCPGPKTLAEKQRLAVSALLAVLRRQGSRVPDTDGHPARATIRHPGTKTPLRGLVAGREGEGQLSLS